MKSTMKSICFSVFQKPRDEPLLVYRISVAMALMRHAWWPPQITCPQTRSAERRGATAFTGFAYTLGSERMPLENPLPCAF